MNSLRANWPEWTATLRRLGLDGWTAWLLEAAGPFNVIGAQLLYIGQPFIGTPQTNERFRELASLLEEEGEARAFAALLRSKASTGSNTHEPLEGQPQ